MPISNKWYPRKRPTLQIDILKSIALNGMLSKRSAKDEFPCKYPTISDAFKGLSERKLIKKTETSDLRSRIRGEIFYKLSPTGLDAFIKEIPSPEEFWTAMIWFCGLSKKIINKNEFDRYYDLFIYKYVGNRSLRGSFFQTSFFDDLFERCSKNIMSEKHKITISNKILDCLAFNRSITLEQIAQITEVSQDEVREVLNNYTMTTDVVINYARAYRMTTISDKINEVTLDFTTHLLIIAKHEKVAIKYELSLLGILVALAIVSLLRQGPTKNDFFEYYDAIASNYPEKLPLIFGKWELLKNSLNFSFFPSIFDFLFIKRSEILSLPMLLEGNNLEYSQ
jgi:hypothetical protein